MVFVLDASSRKQNPFVIISEKAILQFFGCILRLLSWVAWSDRAIRAPSSAPGYNDRWSRKKKNSSIFSFTAICLGAIFKNFWRSSVFHKLYGVKWISEGTIECRLICRWSETEPLCQTLLSAEGQDSKGKIWGKTGSFSLVVSIQ